MFRNFIFYLSIIFICFIAYLNFTDYKLFDFLADNKVASESLSSDNVKLANVKIGDANLKLEIADTESSREQGLSNRENIGFYNGMLFVFDEPSYETFWMKDMNFDLDIIWVDKNKKIVQIDQDVSAHSYNSTDPKSSEKFSSTEKILYVMEVPAGFAKDKDVVVGDVVEIEY